MSISFEILGDYWGMSVDILRRLLIVTPELWHVRHGTSSATAGLELDVAAFAIKSDPISVTYIDTLTMLSRSLLEGWSEPAYADSLHSSRRVQGMLD
jgi:hypothetical protein